MYFVFSYWPLFTIKTLSIHQSLFCLFKASGRLERGSCKEYKKRKLTGKREGRPGLYHKNLLVFKHGCFYCKGWLTIARLKPLSLFISLFYHCLNTWVEAWPWRQTVDSPWSSRRGSRPTPGQQCQSWTASDRPEVTTRLKIFFGFSRVRSLGAFRLEGSSDSLPRSRTHLSCQLVFIFGNWFFFIFLEFFWRN